MALIFFERMNFAIYSFIETIGDEFIPLFLQNTHGNLYSDMYFIANFNM